MSLCYDYKIRGRRCVCVCVCVCVGKTQLVPAGYVVNKLGLGGIGVGPQQNRNSQICLLWFYEISSCKPLATRLVHAGLGSF